MAILFDSVAQGSATSDTLTVQQVIAANSDRLLMVGVSAEILTVTNTGLSTITWNGTALTRIDDFTFTDDDRNWIGQYYLKNPDSGTHDIVVTMNDTQKGISLTGISLYNVDQTTPIEDNANSSSSGTDVGTSVTASATSSWVVDVCSNLNSGTNQVADAGRRSCLHSF